MKKLIAVLIFFFVGITAIAFVNKTNANGIQDLFYRSPCDQPIHYRIDRVDPQFSLTRDAFAADIQEATNIWGAVYGKQLFVYDPQGNLSANLAFDERQSLSNQISGLEKELNTDKSNLDPEIAQYEKLSADFKQKVADLNKQISDWNSRGGAPPDVYQKLKQEQQDLQQQANQLNSMATRLNRSADNYNANVGELNQTVDTFNSALKLKPEEGLYSAQNSTVTIYFNVSHNETIHTLAHEFGHALGFEHNQNPNSIMYPYTTQKITPTSDDISALQAVCARQNIAKLFIEHLQFLFQQTFYHNNSASRKTGQIPMNIDV